jgi:hypothetical protein
VLSILQKYDAYVQKNGILDKNLPGSALAGFTVFNPNLKLIIYDHDSHAIPEGKKCVVTYDFTGE